MSRGGRGRSGEGGERRGDGSGAWSEEELDAAEDGLKLFGTLMYAEEGEATETKAYKKAQAAQAQNAGKPGWQQEVFDSEGRKRLHGAFTGGFSAGYFNTVGSKEGWTPATFVSSRSNRAKIDYFWPLREESSKSINFYGQKHRHKNADSQIGPWG